MSTIMKKISARTGVKSFPSSVQAAGQIARFQKNSFLQPPSRKTFATVVNESAPNKYWQSVKGYENVSEDEFLSYRWQVSRRNSPSLGKFRGTILMPTIQKRNTIERPSKLFTFLNENLPQTFPGYEGSGKTVTRDEFLEDVHQGQKLAPMATRLTPQMLAIVDWSNPYNDPIRRQFLTLASTIVPDHPELTLDSLHETEDSPVNGKFVEATVS